MSLVYTHVNCRVYWSCPGSGGHSGGQVAMSWLAQVALNGLTQPGWLVCITSSLPCSLSLIEDPLSHCDTSHD